MSTRSGGAKTQFAVAVGRTGYPWGQPIHGAELEHGRNVEVQTLSAGAYVILFRERRPAR